MLEFEVAAARSAEEQGEDKDPGLPFSIKEVDKDGKPTGVVREMKAYPPEPGQMAVLMSGLGRYSTVTDSMAAIIDFVHSVLGDEDASYIVRRLMDRKDPFEIEHIERILMAFIKEWSGRPTESLSVSTP